MFFSHIEGISLSNLLCHNVHFLLGCRKVPRSQSYQDVNGSSSGSPNTRLLLEEKEQALLASQETIQVGLSLMPSVE